MIKGVFIFKDGSDCEQQNRPEASKKIRVVCDEN